MKFHPTHAIRKNRNQNQNEMSNIKRELADTKRALKRSKQYGISFVFLLSLLSCILGLIYIDKYSIDSLPSLQLLPSSNSYLTIRYIDEVISSSPAVNVQQLDDTSAVVDSLPNILLIGVQKGGTSAIWNWLTQHNVCIGETFPDKYGELEYFNKEMHFFNNPSRFERGIDFYKEHYKHCVNNLTKNEAEKQLIMDATPNTFWFPENVFEVYKNDPNLKIIVSLREPISRELSFYNHMIQQYKIRPNQTWITDIIVNTNGTIKTFEESMLNMDKQYDKWSYYALYLTKWFKLFDPNQILVLSYKKEVRPGTPAKEKIMEFLGPSLLFGDPYRPYRPGPFAEANEMNRTQKIQMPCSVVERLRPIMDGWNKELYELIASHKPRGISNFPEFETVECMVDQ